MDTPPPATDAMSIDNVDVKIALLQTIAKSIYGSTEGKIREAVANSVDNGATCFIIFADRASRSLSMFDNGTGITDERFKQIFSNIGYGLSKTDESSLSYFGLGLMSVFKLGKKVTIYTRPAESTTIQKAFIEVDKIFDENNEQTSIRELSKWVHIGVSDLSNRDAASPLSTERIIDCINSFPDSFTEIVIEDVDSNDIDMLVQEDFVENIRKTLPLKPHNREPFLAEIRDEIARKWIIDTLGSDDYCPTIDVYYGVNDEVDIRQLWKYFPDFRNNIINSATIYYGTTNSSTSQTNNEFSYYFLMGVDDLEERAKDSVETGFWVRNKNFLVKPSDTLYPSGSRQKMLHEPLKNWFFCEIYHKNMNKFLNVSRNDYVWDRADFIEFRNLVNELVYDKNRIFRKVWKVCGQIETGLVQSFTRIDESIKRTDKTLDSLDIPYIGKDSDKIFKMLQDTRSPELEKEENRIEYLLRKSDGPIRLAQDEDVDLVIDNNMTHNELYTKSYDPRSGKVVFRISPSLFASKTAVLLGKRFDIIFTAGDSVAPVISVDVDNEKLYVNPFNQEIMRYSLSFIDVYIAVEVAHAVSDNKEQMKNYLLKLLGVKYTNASKYLIPFADDLQSRKLYN